MNDNNALDNEYIRLRYNKKTKVMRHTNMCKVRTQQSKKKWYMQFNLIFGCYTFPKNYQFQKSSNYYKKRVNIDLILENRIKGIKITITRRER